MLFIFTQTGSNREKVEDIKRAIAGYTSDNCNCVFSSQYIVDAKLACGNDKDNEFIFVGSLLSTGELNSTAIRDTILQEYLRRSEMVNVVGEMYQINNYCSAQVVEEATYRCLAANPLQATIAPTSGKSAVNLAIEIAIGAGAGLIFFLLLFAGCLILCMCCLRRDVRTKYKEPRTDDLNIQ